MKNIFFSRILKIHKNKFHFFFRLKFQKQFSNIILVRAHKTSPLYSSIKDFSSLNEKSLEVRRKKFLYATMKPIKTLHEKILKALRPTDEKNGNEQEESFSSMPLTFSIFLPVAHSLRHFYAFSRFQFSSRSIYSPHPFHRS